MSNTSGKFKIELLDKSSHVINTVTWNSVTSFYDDVFEYGRIWQGTSSRAVNFRVSPLSPDPAEEAYEVYRTTIADRRGVGNTRVRPDWDDLTSEVRDAFVAAMKTYVAKGGK
jgi:hypothetical protein